MEAEALALAVPLAQALVSCDEPALAELFDKDWLFRLAARSSGVGAKQERLLYEALKTRQGFAREFLCLAPKTVLAFIGFREAQGEQSLVFRATNQDVADHIDFLEFRIGKGGDGKVRGLGRLRYRDGWHLWEKLAASPQLQELLVALDAMGMKLQSDPSAVRTMATKYSDQRSALALDLRAASYLTKADYKTALANYQKRYPRDLSIYMQVYEDLAASGKYELADEAIVAVQLGLGDESILLTERVSLMLESEQFARATKLAEDALVAAPGQREAHYRLLEVHVESRNFAGAVAIMHLMGERFNVRFTEAGMDTSHPAYVELIASPEWASY